MALQRTWNVEPSEQKQRRFMMAQPAWKTDMQRDQPPVPKPRLPVSSLPGLTPLTPVQETEEERVAHLEDGHWSPPDGHQSSTSTQGAGDAALDALEDDASLEGADWDKFWNFQMDNIQ